MSHFLTNDKAVGRVTALGCTSGCLVWSAATAVFGGMLYGTQFVAFAEHLGLLAGIVTVFIVILPLLLWRKRLIAGKHRQTAEAQQRREEEERRLAAAQAVATAAAQRARVAQHLRELAENSVILTENLPKHVARTEVCLDEAEKEFSDGNFPRFWSEIEKAANALAAYDRDIRCILRCREQHHQTLTELGGHGPEFTVSVNALPDAERVYQRMDAIVRTAQRQPDFAKIYEMRQHNKLLAEGFSSLGDALANLGCTIEASVEELRSSLIEGISELGHEQRRSSTELLEEQRRLRQAAREQSAANAQQAKDEAAARAEQERTQRELLERIARQTEKD